MDKGIGKMKIASVNYVQSQQNQLRQREYNIPKNTNLVKQNNDIAFTGNFFTRLGAKIDQRVANISAKAKNLPGSYDDEFHEVLKQARSGDGVPLVGRLRRDLISSTQEHKEAIKTMLDSVPEDEGGARHFLSRALEIIDEKMSPKKKV